VNNSGQYGVGVRSRPIGPGVHSQDEIEGMARKGMDRCETSDRCEWGYSHRSDLFKASYEEGQRREGMMRGDIKLFTMQIDLQRAKQLKTVVCKASCRTQDARTSDRCLIRQAPLGIISGR
jgi:hypothetical protein